MKKILLLIFTTIISITTYAQNNIDYKLIVKYNYQKQVHPTDEKSKIDLENYSLYLNKDNSLFVSDNRIKLDTILNNANFSDLGQLRSLPKPSSNKRIFKNTSSKKIIIYNEFYDKIYKYNDSVNMQWKITNIYDSLNNMKIRKAETKFRGRNYIAWYTSEIPISDGPYKFKGLPGLIIKLYDHKKEINYTLIGLEIFKKNKVLNINYENEALSLTKGKYIEIRKSFKQNPIPYMESQGTVFSEETKRIIRKKFRKRNEKTNNPIELKKDNG
ncbi:GLPGLI family protein [Tenacibaculum insulae]|uniref:GLPGLI family protein n=1 Tax=Tenacibaculum insulae TaxID=2029677 RepID=UPI003AB4C861